MSKLKVFRLFFGLFVLLLVAEAKSEEYNHYRIVDKNLNQLPIKASYSLIVGTNNKKPTKEQLLSLAIKFKNLHVSAQRVFVTFHLPGMNTNQIAYATGHSDPQPKIEIKGWEPKSFCDGPLTYWSYELALCIHEKTEQNYRNGLKSNERILSLVSKESQEYFESGSLNHSNSKYRQAIEDYTKAATLGHVLAMESLSRLYDSTGDTKFQNQEKKIYWGKKAVEGYQSWHNKGDLGATLKLVDYYNFGEVIEKNNMKCLSLLEYAMKKASHEAYFNMGLAYKHGDYGLKKDIVKAKQYFVKAKELGSKSADRHIKLLSKNSR